METNIKGTRGEEGSGDRKVQGQMWGKKGRKKRLSQGNKKKKKIESVLYEPSWHSWLSFTTWAMRTSATGQDHLREQLCHTWVALYNNILLNLFIGNDCFKKDTWLEKRCYALLQIVTECVFFARAVFILQLSLLLKNITQSIWILPRATSATRLQRSDYNMCRNVMRPSENCYRALRIVIFDHDSLLTCIIYALLSQLKAKIKVEFGKPGETIHRIAEQEKVTVIVMGGRGLSTLRRTLLGGVSDYVIKHSQIPVIFVPGLHWEVWGLLCFVEL